MNQEEKEIKRVQMERLITFAAMWSLGALLELDDRLKLQQFLKQNGHLPLPPCTADDTIFEYTVDERGEWVHWETRVPSYVYPTDHTPDYTSILVPNVDNTRTDFLLDTIAKQCKPVMLIGEQVSVKKNADFVRPKNMSSLVSKTFYLAEIRTLVCEGHLRFDAV